MDGRLLGSAFLSYVNSASRAVLGHHAVHVTCRSLFLQAEAETIGGVDTIKEKAPYSYHGSGMILLFSNVKTSA
jgi:hypothetical protein